MKKLFVILPFHGRGDGGTPLVWEHVWGSDGRFAEGNVLMHIDALCGTEVAENFEGVVSGIVKAKHRTYDHRMVYEYRYAGVLILWWLEDASGQGGK
jgi:hypothetical protein